MAAAWEEALPECLRSEGLGWGLPTMCGDGLGCATEG